MPVSTAIGGTYAVRYATDSTATIRVSGDTLTVTAGDGFRIEGASCTLPTDAVLAVLTGSGNHYTGTHWGFNSGTCTSGSAYASTADLNADGSVSLTGPTGTHLLTKTANAPALAVDLPATYDVTYGTAGRATAHVSGTIVTLSVSSPLRVEGAGCDLPVGRVLAVLDGTGTHRSGTHWGFNSATCAPGAAYSSKLYVNSDRSLTVTGPSGPHLFVRRESVPTQPSVDPVGTYGVHYGTAGTAVVHRADTKVTLSVGSGFAVEGASCSLAPTTVLGSYTGTGTTLSGTHFGFNSTTCTQGAAYSSKVHVNSDRSLTVTGPTGPHLFERR
ncbi:MAG: hypothetical protein M5U19_21370 [Microthrixaceae bacterium]|nr:hypothetical protein [Microthrixaceae bacterium]